MLLSKDAKFTITEKKTCKRREVRINKEFQKHIKDLENRLGYVDNNLRYIKVIQALKYWLEKFADLLSNNQALQREYQATYLSYFYTGCGFSFYDRVCNSILEYKYGNRPF